MATAFVFESSEVNQEGYDGLMAALGRAELTAELPLGFIAHFAGPTSAGWRVVDVWEDAQAAQNFYGSKSFQSMTANAPRLDIQEWPLHRIEVAQTLAQID